MLLPFSILNFSPLINFFKNISCPERNFVTIGSNYSKLGRYVSGNDLKGCAQEP